MSLGYTSSNRSNSLQKPCKSARCLYCAITNLKVTMANPTPQIQNVKPVHIDGVSPNDGLFAFFSRQSDEANAHGHDRYEPLLAKEHARLTPTAPFNPHRFTGSGCVRILHEAFNSSNVEMSLAGTYFEWLVNILKNELSSTPGQKLFAVYPSIDRILRPAGYKRTGKGTDSWHCTESDYAIFHRLLDYFFGERASDIVFTVLDNSTPKKSRSNSIRFRNSRRNELDSSITSLLATHLCGNSLSCSSSISKQC